MAYGVWRTVYGVTPTPVADTTACAAHGFLTQRTSIKSFLFVIVCTAYGLVFLICLSHRSSIQEVTADSDGGWRVVGGENENLPKMIEKLSKLPQ